MWVIFFFTKQTEKSPCSLKQWMGNDSLLLGVCLFVCLFVLADLWLVFLVNIEVCWKMVQWFLISFQNEDGLWLCVGQFRSLSLWGSREEKLSKRREVLWELTSGSAMESTVGRFPFFLYPLTKGFTKTQLLAIVWEFVLFVQPPGGCFLKFLQPPHCPWPCSRKFLLLACSPMKAPWVPSWPLPPWSPSECPSSSDCWVITVSWQYLGSCQVSSISALASVQTSNGTQFIFRRITLIINALPSFSLISFQASLTGVSQWSTAGTGLHSMLMSLSGSKVDRYGPWYVDLSSSRASQLPSPQWASHLTTWNG